MRIVADANGRPAPAALATGLTRVQATLPLRLTLAGSVLSGSVDTMTGATALAAGFAGAVPPPQAGEEGYVLTGRGTWEPVATQPYSINVGDDTAATQEALYVSVDGAPAEAKLGSRNGDLVIMDGALDIATFGGGNGGSISGTPIFPRQARFQGHIFQDVDLTTFAPSLPHTPQEAVRITAKAHKSDGSTSGAINIVNNPDGSDIVQPGVYHAIQINVAAAALATGAELGGVVCFLQQKGVTTTSVVPFDGSAQVMNDAVGPGANLVVLNAGLKNDYLGPLAAGNSIAVFARQAGVGTSGAHAGGTGINHVLKVDRPTWWDSTVGTIEAVSGDSTITGTNTAWLCVGQGYNVLGDWDASTNTPTLADGTGVANQCYRVTGGGVQFGRTFVAGEYAAHISGAWTPLATITKCSLLGKWITWRATSGVVISRRITEVVSDTVVVLDAEIDVNEGVLAGAPYQILASTPWDAVLFAEGCGPSAAVSILPEASIAPSTFTGVAAVRTWRPDAPTTEWFGWTWDGAAKFAKASLTGLPVHANNAAALGAGLVAGDVYRTSTGTMMVTY